jgi:RNA polymerase sigma-70 factor, ECF subfamily
MVLFDGLPALFFQRIRPPGNIHGMKETERTPEDGVLLEEEGAATLGARTSPDREAVARVLAGDAAGFRDLVELYEPSVHGLCRKLLGGDSAEAEDLTQETFFRAYRYLPRLEDPERFGPWLYQIARSLCRDRRRRAQVERRALAERADDLRRRAGEISDDGSCGEVGKALSDLPREENEAITLRYFEGLSYDEIARRLGLTFSQVDHLIRKARARLERRLRVRQRVVARS